VREQVTGGDGHAPGDVRVQEIAVEQTTVRLLRATGLEAAVDVSALLGAEAVAEPPYWMHLWPGALALARLLATAPALGAGVRLLELGCGMALPAVVAAARGARVVASDREGDPLRLARQSGRLNGRPIDVLQMDWASPALRGGFDVCVGADIAYDRRAETELAKALHMLLRPGGIAWLADSVNTHREGVAQRLRQCGFAVQISQAREEEEGRIVWVRVVEARAPS
jgi:predicted nicotinamide N-methyase